MDIRWVRWPQGDEPAAQLQELARGEQVMDTAAAPDFGSMSASEIQDWVGRQDQAELRDLLLRMDLSALLQKLPVQRSAGPVDVIGDATPQTDNLQRAAFRIDPETLEWLGRAAGRDREGKSGLVRRALAEFRERHPDLAA